MKRKIWANAYLKDSFLLFFEAPTEWRFFPQPYFILYRLKMKNTVSIYIVIYKYRAESIILVNKSNKCSIRMEKGKKVIAFSCWQTRENVFHVFRLKNGRVFFLLSSSSSSYYCPVGKYCSKIVVFNLSEWYTIRLVLMPLLPPPAAAAAASHTQLPFSVAIDRETRSLHTHLTMRAHSTHTHQHSIHGNMHKQAYTYPHAEH